MTGNMIGKTFNDRYKITDRIGIGGMAEVYRAQDTVLGRVVAVKTMLPQYAADPNFTQRFRQEAAAAANLQSPYIVNVYDWGQDDGTYYIVMEFVRGSDLKTAIKERGAINQRKAAEIGAQVCQALNVAHSMDIIHRDIKPQNIMVQPDGNVKVMDFGIARAKNSVMTQTSSVLGTAHYISPEQAQGKELTPTSDIYSLGIVLYEAITGKLPFDGPDAVSVAMKQVNDMPVVPSEINPDIDPDLEDIIMKALSKQPYDRFETANDMRHALNDYLAGRSVNIADTFGNAKTAVIAGAAAAVGAAGASAADYNDGTAVMPAVAGQGATRPASTNYRSNDNQHKSKQVNGKTIALVIGIIAALAIIGVALFTCMDQGSGDPIPDITGKTVEEATIILQDAGFTLGTQNEAYDDEVEAGRIISQDPPSTKKAEAGTKVNVVVSKGKEQVTVPDLTNMTAEEAKKALEAVGLKGTSGTGEYSDTIEVNRIIRQDPAPATQVSKGDTITYIPSLGNERGEVPDVVGMHVNDAILALENAGLKVTQNTDYSDTVTSDYVISQNPNGGFKTEKGATVTITISQGPKPADQVTVQDMSGTSEGTATSVLKGLGLNPTVTYEYHDTIASGNVISQNPNGGKVDVGTTVNLIVSQGPKPASSGGTTP